MLTIRINYEGTFNILNLAQEFKSKLLFASSSEIYGKSIVKPQNENIIVDLSTTSPRSCYAEGKRIAETLIDTFSKVNNLGIQTGKNF